MEFTGPVDKARENPARRSILQGHRDQKRQLEYAVTWAITGLITGVAEGPLCLEAVKDWLLEVIPGG